MAQKAPPDFTLQTRAGTPLKPLGVHPDVRDMVSVETVDGFKTTVQRSSLLENEALLALFASESVPASTEAPDAAFPAPENAASEASCCSK